MTWSKLTADENKLEAPPLIRKIAFASETIFHERIEALKNGVSINFHYERLRAPKMGFQGLQQKIR